MNTTRRNAAARPPYVRPMQGWWRRDPFFVRYMVRELTAVAVLAYAIVLAVGIVRLAQGEAAWNGVAILSRAGLEDVVAGLPGGPGFPHQEARAVAATCGGIRVNSVYVPNGRTPDSEHYRYKLEWLAALREVVLGRHVVGDLLRDRGRPAGGRLPA